MNEHAKPVAPGLVRGAAAVGDRAVQWISHAIERRLNAENFIAANQTPYEVIYANGLTSVRRYAPLTETEIEVGRTRMPVAATRHRVPVLLVPPMAANSLNFDLLPNRSLVRYLLASGFAVYLVDWGDPDADHSRLDLADYTTDMLPKALAAVRHDSGEQEVSLFGYCMGGLFCLIYAGWSHDPQIRNIVTVASPIDAYQIGIAGRLVQMMNHPLRVAARYVPLSLHDIDPKYLRVPGWVSSWVFKMTNPVGTVQSYIDLLMNLWDREFVTEYQTTATWFNKMHDYPGGIVQDFIVRVGLANELARGELRLGRGKNGKTALLDRIDCSLLAIAGRTDKIVTIEAARKVLDIIGSEDKDFVVAPGGHAGVFAGSAAPATTWALASDWLQARSD